MSIASTLILTADDEADRLEAGAGAAKHGEQTDELKAKVNAAVLARRRVQQYRLMVDGKYQCPHCWIVSGRAAAVHAISRDDAGVDRFRCNECGQQYEDRV